MNRRIRGRENRLQLPAPLFEWLVAQILIPVAKEIEEHDRCWSLRGEKFHPRGSRMDP